MASTSSLGATVSQRGAGRWFVPAIAAVATALVVIGFAPTFFLRRFFDAPALSPLLVVHGVVFSAWFALLIVQVALVRSRRIELHRRLGIAGAALAIAMVVIGVRVAIEAAAEGTGGARVALPPLQFLIIPLGAVAIFGALVAAAIHVRRDRETHKRLILLATIDLLGPAFARILDNGFGVTSPIGIIAASGAFVLVCAVVDRRTRGRIHPVFRYVGPAFMLSFPLRFAIAQTDTWHAIATWLTR